MKPISIKCGQFCTVVMTQEAVFLCGKRQEQLNREFVLVKKFSYRDTFPISLQVHWNKTVNLIYVKLLDLRGVQQNKIQKQNIFKIVLKDFEYSNRLLPRNL